MENLRSTLLAVNALAVLRATLPQGEAFDQLELVVEEAAANLLEILPMTAMEDGFFVTEEAVGEFGNRRTLWRGRKKLVSVRQGVVDIYGPPRPRPCQPHLN